MVRIHPDPPEFAGAVAQLGEHLLCKQGVVGSIPSSSTTKEEASIAKASTESRSKREDLLLIFGSVPRSSVAL